MQTENPNIFFVRFPAKSFDKRQLYECGSFLAHIRKAKGTGTGTGTGTDTGTGTGTGTGTSTGTDTDTGTGTETG